MSTGSKRKNRPLVIRILRVLLFGFLGFLILVLILTGYLYLDRDNISKRLLLSSNKYTRGELSFESIAFNPFIQFPSMSMLIREVEYYENPIYNRNQNERPIAKIDRLYAAVDISELIKGRIDVSRILLEEGKIHLVQYPDSSLNLLNAIEIPEPLPGRKGNEQEDSLVLAETVQKPSAAKSTGRQPELEILLDQLVIKDLSFEFENRVDKNRSLLDVDKLRASLEYTPEAVRSKVKTDIEVEMIQISDNIRIGRKTLHLETAFVFSRSDQSLVLDPSMLTIDRARLNLEGGFSFRGEGSVDLTFDGSDHDFTFFQLFLSETGLKNLEEGDMYFRGTVRSNTLKGMPVADLSFGLNKVRMFVPRANDYIDDLNLSGSLNTGSRTDLSEARLRIDTLFATLPRGYVHAALSIKNFKAPEIDLVWDLTGNLSGIDQVFKFDFMDSLSGGINSKVIVKGARYNPDSGYVDADYFEAKLQFDSASFVFPGIISVELLNGRIHHLEDTTRIHDLKALSGDSDFFVNGEIINAMYLPFQVDTIITADLKIQSELFDLPGFLEFVPEVRKAFPYRIRDIDLDVSVTTSTNRLIQMRPNPSMTFGINHLYATVEEFLPPVSISNGLFELDHRDERVYLDFSDFNIGILGSSLDADLELHSPASRRTFLKMNIGVNGLNPYRLIRDDESDTIPEFLDGLLSGTFILDLYFPHDSLQTLKKIDFRQADLLFINSRDTIETLSFNLHAEDIYIDTDKNPNPFASLTSKITMSSEKTRINSFIWEGFEFNIEAEDGQYSIHPNKTNIFGKEGSGLYVLEPFSEVPSYKIRYLVEQYDVQDLMSNFRNDTLISGKMDFLVDVSLEDPGDHNLLSTLNGQIILKGKDLTLYGIELDKLIRKFERSQNFNLVDVGAVVFAGPAGLALTKGGAYADILVASYGETSRVKEMISDWEISQGKINLRDLAFSTEENRVAAQGWINLATDSMDITIALIDKKGCSIIEQSMYGSIKEPDRSQMKFLATVLAPVINLLEMVLGADCEVFYKGSIPHPGKK